jgi:hypothetical protein
MSVLIEDAECDRAVKFVWNAVICMKQNGNLNYQIMKAITIDVLVKVQLDEIFCDHFLERKTEKSFDFCKW